MPTLKEEVPVFHQRVVPLPVDLWAPPTDALNMFRAWVNAYMDDSDPQRMWVPVGRIGPMVILGHPNPAEASEPSFPLWAFGLVRIPDSAYAKVRERVVAALQEAGDHAEFVPPDNFDPPRANAPQARRRAIEMMLSFPGAEQDAELARLALANPLADDSDEGLPAGLPQGWREAAIAIADSAPVVDLTGFLPNPDVAALVPESFAREHDLVPTALEGNIMTVATPTIPRSHKANTIHSTWKAARDSAASHIKLQLVLTPRGGRADTDRRLALKGSVAGTSSKNRRLAPSDNIRARVNVKRDEIVQFSISSPHIEDRVLLNLAMYRAIEAGASDLHIDKEEGAGRFRIRVDGFLRPLGDGHFALNRIPNLMQLLRVHGGVVGGDLNAVDSKFTLRCDDRLYDVRVSVLPDADLATSGHGFAALRFLPKDGGVRSLAELKLSESEMSDLLASLEKQNGIVLVTGPTGSGKTTTLNAMLQQINHGMHPGEEGTRKIITVEDPVEYTLDGVQQMNVSKQIPFAEAIRRILRQDPDVILIGEIRDEETARVAIEAARTGHLVFASLHTNGAAETVDRMLGLGVAPKQLSSVLRTVVAQRLVPVLCRSCKRARPPTPEELKLFADKRLRAPTTVYDPNPSGCSHCTKGWHGQVPVMELVRNVTTIKRAIAANADEATIQDACIKAGFLPLFSHALLKAAEGITSLQEAMDLNSSWD